MRRIRAENVFIFDKYEIDRESKEIRLYYNLIVSGKETVLMERYSFPQKLKWGNTSSIPFHNAVRALHVIAGVSYWKAYCPRVIRFASYSLSKEESRFFKEIYENGLGEFFYRNKIDFRGLIDFPSLPQLKNKAYKVKTNDRSLLLFGGGKDSLVSAELLKKARKNFKYLFVSSGKLPELVSNLLPKDAIIVYRHIDPKIIEINKDQKSFNGHIPITSIIAAVGEITALLYGFNSVIASNERSADYGNAEYLGRVVNHQWSKSYEAERLINRYFQKFITPSITFFSLLRPFYEIKIIEIFSRHKKYLSRFSSCNANFKAFKSRSTTYWCGHCPKCVFVFSMLSVYLPKSELINIFGKNLFDDPALLPLFKELLGLRAVKPFECVGTFDEMKWAIHWAINSPEYMGDTVIKELSKNKFIAGLSISKLKYLFNIGGHHQIPPEFRRILSYAD